MNGELENTGKVYLGGARRHANAGRSDKFRRG